MTPFNLAKDPGETTDVRAEHPEVVDRLRKMLADARQLGYTRSAETGAPKEQPR